MSYNSSHENDKVLNSRKKKRYDSFRADMSEHRRLGDSLNKKENHELNWLKSIRLEGEGLH
jgi:hypothetical protein